MLGRPASCEPVWKKVIAGSWLIASVYMDLMTHISSAMVAVCGSSSLSQMPLLPCCANLKIDGATGNFACPAVMPVRRCPLRIGVGQILPRTSAECGL